MYLVDTQKKVSKSLLWERFLFKHLNLAPAYEIKIIASLSRAYP